MEQRNIDSNEEVSPFFLDSYMDQHATIPEDTDSPTSGNPSSSGNQAQQQPQGRVNRGVSRVARTINRSSTSERNKQYCASWRQKQKQEECLTRDIQQLKSDNQVLQRNLYSLWIENIELKRQLGLPTERI